MKRIEQIERQVADLETKLKRNKDVLKEKSEVKAVDSRPFTNIFLIII